MMDGGDSEWRRPFFLINNKTSKSPQPIETAKKQCGAANKHPKSLVYSWRQRMDETLAPIIRQAGAHVAAMC
jgi:hypothetical protein